MSYDSKHKGAEVEIILDSVAGKVDKQEGKQLSTEDFTTLLKQKLEGLSNYDDSEIVAAFNQLRTEFDALVGGNASAAINSFNEIIAFLEGIEDSQKLDSIIASIEQQIAAKPSHSDIPTKVSQLTNDSKYQAEAQVWGTVLYNVEVTATNYGTVTLSDSLANYEVVDFYCATNDKHCFSNRVYKPDGKKVAMTGVLVGNSSLFLKSKVYDCSGNKMTTAKGTNDMVFAGEWGSEKNNLARGENTVGIYRVVGYKK